MDDSESGIVVIEGGLTLVVRFASQAVPEDFDVAACRRDLTTLVEEHGCQTLKFDLTGIELAPSGLIAGLRSLERKGITVHLINPSTQMRDILLVAKLDRHFTLEESGTDEGSGS